MIYTAYQNENRCFGRLPIAMSRNHALRCSFSSLLLCVLPLIGSGGLQGRDLAVVHDAELRYDLGGVHLPVWSNGALVTFVSNRTISPEILSFDNGGRQLPTLRLTIPDSDMIDLDDASGGPNGVVAVCGTAYDRSGRGSGFFALLNANGGMATVVRLFPYYPSRITVASDGSIWTAGLEVTNSKDSTPPASGVIRRFDSTGKMTGSFVPRSTIASPQMVLSGMLRSARGRVGWYTGPIGGPGSQYYEFLADGMVHKYPAIALGVTEVVNGLGLTDDGMTFLTTRENSKHLRRLLSINGVGGQWEQERLPSQIGPIFILYGASGSSLVFLNNDRSRMTFIKEAKTP